MARNSTGWAPIAGDNASADADGSAYISHLAATGVLDEADLMFDQIEQDINPCDPKPVDDVIAEARRIFNSR